MPPHRSPNGSRVRFADCLLALVPLAPSRTRARLLITYLVKPRFTFVITYSNCYSYLHYYS